MTLRPVTAADLTEVTIFLRRHEAGSMFLLSNTAQGLDQPGPYGTRLWRADATGGGVSGVIGLTRGGALMTQWPGNADWSALRAVLVGERLSVITGPAAQVAALPAALGLEHPPPERVDDEPGFTLELAAMVVPDGPGALAGLDAADAALIGGWRAAFLHEVNGVPLARAAVDGPAEVARWRAVGSHRLLVERGRPLALCGFNARLSDVVQVGGVYVPPELRGRGHARRAVALLLAEARDRGVTSAVLFAASEAAARAYRAIGFQPAARFGRVLLGAPRRVPPCP